MSKPSKFSFFIGATKAGETINLTRTAEWLHCEPQFKRPWPTSHTGLVHDFEGWRLFSPTVKPQYWHPGMSHLRLKRPRDPLTDVIGAAEGARVLDCTLGMGHDALVLSNAGYRVTGIEQCAPLLFFTNQGLLKYRPDLARTMTFRCGRFESFLATSPPNAFHTIYLDPMFEKTSKRLDGFTWSMMRTLGLSDSRYTHDDIRNAFRIAEQQVVLKLSPFERPPLVDGLPTPLLCGSRRVKFAKWSRSSIT